MLRPVKKEELNNISLTGMRSLVLLSLLIKAPRSLDEIREAFLEMRIIDESCSKDTLRIDINTIKSIGCKLSRPTPNNNHKYELLDHPFSLKITDEDIRYFKKVYSRLKADANIKMLIEFDELINKIAEHIYDTETKEKFLGISAFKYYRDNFIKDLISDCKNERTLELLYRKPPSKNEYKKEVIAQKLVFNNDQVYLHCFDKSVRQSIVLNIRRIVKILSRKTKENSPDLKYITVKFHLKDFDIDALTDEEIVIEYNENGCIIEGNYYNKFLAIQRMLSFGSKCTVLEPFEIREEIITRLKEMRKIYDC